MAKHPMARAAATQAANHRWRSLLASIGSPFLRAPTCRIWASASGAVSWLEFHAAWPGPLAAQTGPYPPWSQLYTSTSSYRNYRRLDIKLLLVSRRGPSPLWGITGCWALSSAVDSIPCECRPALPIKSPAVTLRNEPHDPQDQVARAPGVPSPAQSGRTQTARQGSPASGIWPVSPLGKGVGEEGKRG